MSARQPFLPSRPASRAVNVGDSAGAPAASVDALEMAPARPLNLSGLKKSAMRGTRSVDAAEGAANGSWPTAKGTTTRIYAPRPSPPSAVPQGPGFAMPEFKTPTLPPVKGGEEAAAATHIPTPDAGFGFFHTAAASGGGPGHSPAFFGRAQPSFDSVASLDDSGYFSSVSEQTDTQERFSLVRRLSSASAAGGDRPGSRATQKHAMAANSGFDSNLANPLKRARHGSPGDDDEVILIQDAQRHSTPRQQSIHGSSRSQNNPQHANGPENARPGDAQAFALPSHMPGPTAAIGSLPGLDFSDTDLARYAGLYEQGSVRWASATPEEWLAGADEITGKFGEIVDMIKEHMTSKMGLYKSLHGRLADEHSALEERAKELRDAGQTIVRDSGSIGGGLDPSEF
ncbi:hypothetical protein BC834DRAFT_975555 [Gloeopeniophorella convolvens]|nr:hypothetical protein BC834DRAFT_975555 [Gloeopeniophorella convolvens]